MFDSILTHSQAPRGNMAGLGLSLLISGMACGVSIFLFKSASRDSPKDVDVTLITARSAPPPPPPPPPGGDRGRQVERKTIPRKREMVLHPKVEPDSKPAPEETPPEPSAEPEGQPGGVAGGVAGGVVGGVVGGVRGGIVGGVIGGTGTSVLPFGAGMTRPQQLSGGAPQYNREALAARVEGKVMIRCTITLTGEVQDCKVIRSVPMLDDLALAALKQSRYTPVTFQGHPEAVQYLFTFNFKLP